MTPMTGVALYAGWLLAMLADYQFDRWLAQIDARIAARKAAALVAARAADDRLAALAVPPVIYNRAAEIIRVDGADR